MSLSHMRTQRFIEVFDLYSLVLSLRDFRPLLRFLPRILLITPLP